MIPVSGGRVYVTVRLRVRPHGSHLCEKTVVPRSVILKPKRAIGLPHCAHLGARLSPVTQRRAPIGLLVSPAGQYRPRRSPTRSGTSTTGEARSMRRAPLKRMEPQCKDPAAYRRAEIGLSHVTARELAGKIASPGDSIIR